MTALEADPARRQYWLSYIDALFQAGQLEDARQVLALARQQGLEGDDVDALVQRLEDGVQISELPDAGNIHSTNEQMPASLSPNQNTNSEPNNKSGMQEKLGGEFAQNVGKDPSLHDIDMLVTLFTAGRFSEAATLAKNMTECFPLHGVGWKALGAVYMQMGHSANALVPMQKAATLSPDDAEAHNNLGIALYALGRLVEAEASYRRALLINPAVASAHCNLGATLQKLGRLDEAEASYRQALQLNQNYAKALNNLGSLQQELGKLDRAEESYRRVLQIHPDDAEAHYNLGITLKELGRLDEAEATCRQALQINPNLAEANFNLGNILYALNRMGEAEASYRRALQIKPDYAEVSSNLGIILHDLGRLDEANASYRLALQVKPDYAEAYSNLGRTLRELGRLDEAETCYRRALQIKPEYAEAYINLGSTLHDLGRLDEAENCYRKVLEIWPESAEAFKRLGASLENQGHFVEAKACYRKAWGLGSNGARIQEALMLPAIMGTRYEMLESRKDFEQNLNILIAEKITLDDPLKDVGITNFYLAYHGLNDRDLQIKVAKFYEQACPTLLYSAIHCFKPKTEDQRKIKVGFLSGFFSSHSVSLCFSKIIEIMSLKDQFEVSLISHHTIDEEIYSQSAGKRVHIPNNLARAREMIAELELDILIYLDIGMEPLSYFLAFSRLARVQCVLGGHPVTTGIGNMDYFVSAEIMESLNADEHYSEKLVRLPTPLTYFARPVLPTVFKTRHELDLPDARHLYMCPMKLQKIHPDFDEAITRILQLDANGVVVLFEDNTWQFWKVALAKRFEETIPTEVRERVIFLPWLKNSVDFISAIAIADVVLDPFNFGIGSTAAMTSVTGTPLVTKVGEFMRGRVGVGYCKMLDITECIAEDAESYARKAVEIASDRILRKKISTKILKNNSVLYENLQPIEEFVDFIDSLAGNWHNS